MDACGLSRKKITPGRTATMKVSPHATLLARPPLAVAPANGSSAAAVRKTIVEGRQGRMPSHAALLGEDRVRLIAAYVYSLSASDLGDGEDLYGDD